MPAQQRLGLDYLQGVSPSAAQPGQDEQEQAVIAVDPRSADTATEHDHLLTEQRILGQEFRSCAGEIPATLAALEGAALPLLHCVSLFPTHSGSHDWQRLTQLQNLPTNKD